MQIQKINRDSQEKVFISVKNVQGATMTTGYLAAYAIGGNSFDGLNAVLPASGTVANLPGFIGVAVQDIPNNGYGRVQSYGFTASVLLSNTGTSVTINAGDPLVPGALAGGATSAAPTYANSGFRFILASNVTPAVSAGQYISGFIRGV